MSILSPKVISGKCFGREIKIPKWDHLGVRKQQISRNLVDLAFVADVGGIEEQVLVLARPKPGARYEQRSDENA